MRDDLGITTRIENGKAYLEFTLPEKLREGDAWRAAPDRDQRSRRRKADILRGV